MPLRRFLQLLESRPDFSYPTRLLTDAIGAHAEKALCDAGVLGPQGPATWYPCAREFLSCRRVVALDGDKLHLVCGRSSGGCPPEVFAEHELGQHVLDEGAFIRLVQGLFGAGGQPARREGRGQPVYLGRGRPGDRDLWLWLRPSEPDFANWIRDVERALVLVPTPARIRIDTFERHGAGQPVEVVHLDRALAVDQGQIVRPVATSAPPARVPWVAGPLVERPGARLRVPAGVRWSHLTFEWVHDELVSMRCGAHPPVRRLAACASGRGGRPGRPSGGTDHAMVRTGLSGT